jgi:hypothetical protein
MSAKVCAVGTVYGIMNTKDTKLYVGSTSKTLNKRMQSHQSSVRCGSSASLLHIHMRELGIEYFFIFPLQQFKNISKTELHRHEGSAMRTMKSDLNTYIAGRTPQEYRSLECNKILKQRYNNEYYAANATAVNTQVQEYYGKNKEAICERMRRYTLANKESIRQKDHDRYLKDREARLIQSRISVTCICGSTHRVAGKQRHMRSVLHANYMKSIADQ